MNDNNTPLDQTIPLRVSYKTKSVLVGLAKAESRSLNNWINMRFAEIIANATSIAAHNPSGLIGDGESILDLGEGSEQPTPHKVIVNVKSKPKPKPKAKAKSRR